MTGREVLTLQFGHYANFVGAHLWNTQEFSFDYNADTPTPINHDVFYREGLTHNNQVTFTPRTLLVDLKGSLKSLPETGGLYERAADIEKSKEAALWHEHQVEVQTAEKHENQVDAHLEAKPQENRVLDENVSVWSDFLYSRFHPRTVNVVKEFELGNEEKAFDVFPLGRDLWKSEQFQDDFTDKIRQYLEECDSFQGFQVLVDANNAFFGLATSCLEHLQDEYERKSIFAMPLLPAYHDDYGYETSEDECKSLIKDSLRVLNTALGFSHLGEKCSLFVPLSVGSNGWRQPGPKRNFNHVIYDHKSSFHSTAILATALDTFTLQYRLKETAYSLRDLCCDLTPHGRKMAAASVCLPFSVNETDTLLDCLDNWDGLLTKTITPNCKIGTDRVMQMFTLRGVPQERLKKSNHKNLPAYQYDSVKDMLTYYLSCTTYASANQVAAVEKPLKLGPFYPKIFDNRVGRNGNIVHERPVGVGVESIPVMAGLHTSSEIAPTLESLHAEAAKIKHERLYQFKSAGLEMDDFKESLEKLLELKECYED